MGKAKKTRKCGAVKRLLNPNDQRLQHKAAVTAKTTASASRTADGLAVRHVEKPSSSLFFRYNASLGPPYQLLLDTNFINFSIQNKLDLHKASMDCLLAKCRLLITDCVMAELEKLGSAYRVALRIAKDERIGRLQCTHAGSYADDCLVRRVQQHKCYIVCTCDRDLKRRIRKIPGVPILYITKHQFSIERFADVNAAPRE